MSNVSLCEAEPMPKEPYPVWAIVGVQLGIVIIIAQVIKEGLLEMYLIFEF